MSQYLSIALDHGLELLVVLTAGLGYALWFRRPRTSFGFIWLLWLTLGLVIRPLGNTFGFTVEHDLASVAFNWLPWNLLLLALLPRTALRSPGTVAVVILLVLQLSVPLLIPVETWRELPGLNERIAGWVPASVAEWLSPIEPVVVVAAAVAMFIRWQWTGRITELALALMSTALLLGVLRPPLLVVAIIAGGAMLFLAALYGSHRMAFVDGLTGLRNRRSFDLSLGSLRNTYAVGMMDVDRFKRINDRFGHDFGDQVLRMVAFRLRRIRGFRAYRYGGEEFALLFRGRQVENAEAICEDVRKAMIDPPMAFRAPDRPAHKPLNKAKYRQKVPGLKVTVSIGLAFSDAGNQPESVVEAADQALYKAKRGGRNKVVVAKSRSGKS